MATPRSSSSARIIDGRAVADRVRSELGREAAAFRERVGRAPGLATVLIGDDEASAVYVANKHKACAAAGFESFKHNLPANTSVAEAEELIDQLNVDDQVDGILCQLPVPDHMDGTQLTGRIKPEKDVDGLTEASAGRLALGVAGLRPCTPSGVMVLLAEADANLDGCDAVVLGRSNLFGKPMAQLLTAANATVTLCHSHTKDLAAVARKADVLIAAVGRPHMVDEEWVKPGAIVIDVGINRTDDGLVGDVDFDPVSRVAAAITPVPGGVGPMTITMLLQNTLQAARAAAA